MPAESLAELHVLAGEEISLTEKHIARQLEIIGEPQRESQSIEIARWTLSYLNEILAAHTARRNEILLKIKELAI